MLNRKKQLTLAKQHLKEAEQLINQDAPDLPEQATKLLEQVTPIFEAAEEWKKYVVCLNLKGKILLHLNMYDEILSIAEKALEIAQSYLGLHRHIEISKSYCLIGMLYTKQKNINISIEYYTKALLALPKSNSNASTKQKAYIYGHLGRCHGNKCDYDTAIEYYLKSLSLEKKLLNDNGILAAKLYLSLANAYQSKSNFTVSTEYAYKSLYIFRKITENSDNLYCVSCYNTISINLYQQRLYDKAIEQLEKTLPILAHTPGDQKHNMCNMLTNISIICIDKGDIYKAIPYLEQALSLFPAITPIQKYCISNAHTNYGIACSELNQHEPAILHFKKALHMKEEINSLELASCYNNIAHSYLKIKDYEQSIYYYQLGLETQLSSNNIYDFKTALSYEGLGICNWNLNSYDKALEYHYKALEIRNEILVENHIDIALSYLNIANTHASKSNYEYSIAYYQKSLLVSGLTFKNIEDPHEIPTLPEIYDYIMLDIVISKSDFLFQYYNKYHDPKYLHSALYHYLLVDKLIDQMRSSFQAEGSKIHLAQKAKEICEKAIEVALVQYRNEC